ncbi:PEP-utilizing enzyme [Streptomyces goshikiensis]|uniref:PEP-utilizing enzyme n=1 Tax=Streptomyces goshikiensis TaxID=1942 RepID=UPI0037247B77
MPVLCWSPPRSPHSSTCSWRAHGGRTSRAAIVSRELGVPAVVGTGRAAHVLHDGQKVTVSCAEGGRGKVYEGRSPTR